MQAAISTGETWADRYLLGSKLVVATTAFGVAWAVLACLAMAPSSSAALAGMAVWEVQTWEVELEGVREEKADHHPVVQEVFPQRFLAVPEGVVAATDTCCSLSPGVRTHHLASVLLVRVLHGAILVLVQTLWPLVGRSCNANWGGLDETGWDDAKPENDMM